MFCNFCTTIKEDSPRPGSNWRPSVYKTDALPLSYWGTWKMRCNMESMCDRTAKTSHLQSTITKENNL